MALIRFTYQCSKININQPACIGVRNFSNYKNQPHDDITYRGNQSRRTGYQAHHHQKGLLPRLKIKERKLDTYPTTAREDPWSRRLAREGENDCIKIFSDDETIQQHELLTHIPEWLRGYKNTGREYSVLMLKRKEFEHWKVTKPLKWLHLEQRIKFLYRMINNKYAPPAVEKLNRSRY